MTGFGNDVVDRGVFLRRSGQHTDVCCRRLSILNVLRGVYDNQFTAAFGVSERARENHYAAVLGFTRLHELDRCAVGAGVVAPLAVQQFQLGAVRIHPVQVHLVVGHVVVPAAEDDLAVLHHRRVEVVALVKGNLLEARAVVVHDMQVERKLFLVLIHGRERTLVLVKQQCLRLRLARRCENDAAVRQVFRHDVVADFCRQVIGNYANQRIRLEGVLPDVPRRDLVFFVDAFLERRAHRKQQTATVIIDFNVANSTESLRDVARDVHGFGTDRGAITKEKIGSEFERDLRTQILLFENAVVVRRNWRFDIGDRKIDHNGIGILPGAQLDTFAFAACSNGDGRNRQRNHPGRFGGDSFSQLSR